MFITTIAFAFLIGLTLQVIYSFLDDGVRFIDVDIRAERERALREGDIIRTFKAQERLNR